MAPQTARTSLSHPLQIAAIPVPGGGGVGVTFCPGKCQPHAMTGSWRRDLAADLKAIRTWGAGVVITLVTSAELAELQVAHLGEAARAQGLTWLHLPITDVSTPTAEWERAWSAERSLIHAELDRGGSVVAHCKGGLGRAGLIAARILVERGMASEQAIAEVRRVRPGAIQTAAQEAYVRGLDRSARADQAT